MKYTLNKDGFESGSAFIHFHFTSTKSKREMPHFVGGDALNKGKICFVSDTLIGV